jgi:hypothetical protein
MKDDVAAATHGVGIPTATEVIQRAVGLGIPIWV